MAKITMQDIAEELGLSRVTVSKAFNNQAGVSETVRELVISKAKEMGYAKLPNGDSAVSAVQHTVAAVISRPESSIFWTNIIHHMAQELADAGINLLYAYVPPKYKNSFALPPLLLGGGADAIVALNVYDRQILQIINTLSAPKVFLDTVMPLPEEELNGDLMLIEGYTTECKIVTQLIENGHSKIGFVGDIGYARTNNERYKGYCTAMENHGLPVLTKYCFTDSIDIFSYETQIDAFLDSLTEWPTAFACASDYVAHFIKHYLDTHEDSPKVTLAGFDHSNEYENVAGRIMTADVSTEQLGRRIARQLCYRIDYPDAPKELIFVMPRVIYV